MIPPVPPNFGFSLIAIPVWEWEQLEASIGAAPAPSAPALEEGTTPAENDPPEASKPDMCLVFKGYEWRPAVQWYLTPSAICAGCVGSVEADLQTDDEETRQNEWERTQHPDARAPERTGMANRSNDADAGPPFDSSKPRR